MARHVDGTVLIADSIAATIWQVDPKSRSMKPWLRDAALARDPAVKDFKPGANALKRQGDRLLISNSSRGTITTVAIGSVSNSAGAVTELAKVGALGSSIDAMRHRKLTVVADRLGLMQSAISHSVKRLRRAFDDELFMRRPFGVEPTERALYIADRVERILAQIRRGRTQKTQRQVKFACSQRVDRLVSQRWSETEANRREAS